MTGVERDDFTLLVVAFIDWLQLSNYDCNQIRSPGVRFGKRAVVGAVRVFEPIPGLRFLFGELSSPPAFSISKCRYRSTLQRVLSFRVLKNLC